MPSQTMPTALEGIPPSTALREFITRVSETVSADGQEGFWNCEPHFRSLMSSNFLRDPIHQLLQRIEKECDFAPPFTSDRLMTLVRTPQFGLAIWLNEGPAPLEQRRIYDYAEHRMLGVIGPAPLQVECFHQPQPLPHDVLDRSRLLQPRGCVTLAPGDIRGFRAAEDVALIMPPSGGPSLIALFTSARKMGVRWEYDRALLAPTKMVSADTTASRLEFTAQMLAAFGNQSSVAPLTRLMEHSDHSVRWAAIKAVMRIDSEAGMKLLHGAASDPHPYIRNAVARSFEKLRAAGRLA